MGSHGLLSLESETALLDAICNTRPIGVAKSFKVISILRALNLQTSPSKGGYVSAAQIRKYLDVHYDTDMLDSMANDALLHTILRQEDFRLPIDEFASLAGAASTASSVTQADLPPLNPHDEKRHGSVSLQISTANTVEGKRRRMSVASSYVVDSPSSDDSFWTSAREGAVATPRSASVAPEEDAMGAVATNAGSAGTAGPPGSAGSGSVQKKRGRPRLDRSGSDASGTVGVAAAAVATVLAGSNRTPTIGSVSTAGGSSILKKKDPASATSSTPPAIPAPETKEDKAAAKRKERAEKVERDKNEKAEKAAEREKEKAEKAEQREKERVEKAAEKERAEKATERENDKAERVAEKERDKAERESKADSASMAGDDEDELNRRRSRRVK
ncbi:hypothetical protein BC830DRAFT_1169921 [Chytriomyces sp. MP71]|nr:hypothetical protein BC830DRAFT_1169921 [Chytriomyces sp. MP71]